jgi:hypothetical protein
VIISYFDPASVGNLGLMIIPCIVFYIMQLFIDSFIANTWASKYERFAAIEEACDKQMQELEARQAGGTAAGGLGLPGKVAAKLSAGGSAGGSGGGAEQLIGAGVVVAGGAGRPSRPALLNRRRSSASDSEEAGLMQTVELSDVNPLAQPRGGGGGAAAAAAAGGGAGAGWR